MGRPRVARRVPAGDSGALWAIHAGGGPQIRQNVLWKCAMVFPSSFTGRRISMRKPMSRGPWSSEEACSVEAGAEAGDAVLLAGARMRQGDCLSHALLGAGGLLCQAP